ncbi:hypothetical protein [Nocardia xishanensis]|uniref:Resolvase/invertase-type recombinase catalytic domain-containing protein n=1 Tax=Nocardia xishanensis TaxID=238964 RepID=A0ABW7WW71_9NOCA
MTNLHHAVRAASDVPDPYQADTRVRPHRVKLPPLCYGYVRTDLIGTDRIGEFDDELALIARVQFGHELAGVFHEPTPQNCQIPPALACLATECARAEANMILTPVGHLSGLAVARMCILDYLAARSGAHVIEIRMTT